MATVNILGAREKIKKHIIEYLKVNHKSRRDALFGPVMAKLGLSKEQLADKSGDGIYSRYKSICGSTINELVKLNILHYEDKDIFLTAPSVPFDQKAIKEFFLSKYLTDEEKKDKKQGSKLNNLKSILGGVIRKYQHEIETRTKEEAIDFIQGKLEDSDKIRAKISDFLNLNSYPITPLGNRLRKQKEVYGSLLNNKITREEYEIELSRAIMELISIAGGEFFEKLSLNLLKTVYAGSVISDRLTGGPDDNGIDSELIVKDPLGIIEKVVVQAKTKYNEIASINVKVLREFIGVMTAYSADKGVLIANTDFHKLTIALAKKCNNVILIGKQELYELMTKFKVGVIMDKNQNPLIDDQVFMME